MSQTIDRYNRDSLSTGSRIGQNALIRRKVFKEAINIMGETISDLDIELDQKGNKIHF